MTTPALSLSTVSRRLFRPGSNLCCAANSSSARRSFLAAHDGRTRINGMSLLPKHGSVRTLSSFNLVPLSAQSSSSASSLVILSHNSHRHPYETSFFGHDRRQPTRRCYTGSSGKRNADVDDIYLPFFGKYSRLPPSSSSLLKQDDHELSADELRLKKALNDYIQQQQHEFEQSRPNSNNINDDESEDDNHETERYLLENLQRAYMDLEYWEEALQIEAFKCHMYFVEDTDEYADSIHAQGKFYLRQEDFVHSKRFYEEALEYFERTENSVQQGHVLISLAGWYFFRNQLDEALDCLQRSEPMLDSNPALLYKCLDNQGLVYRLWGEFHVALDKYQQALQVVLVDDVETRSALKMHVADMHLALDEAYEALKVYQELLIELASTPASAFTSDSEQQQTLGMRGVLLHNIATIHADLGEHDLALTEFQEALAAKQSAGGENNPEVAKTLNSLGALYAGVFDEKHVALEYFQQALLIARIHAEDGKNSINDPDVVNALQNISIVEQELAGKRKS